MMKRAITLQVCGQKVHMPLKRQRACAVVVMSMCGQSTHVLSLRPLGGCICTRLLSSSGQQIGRLQMTLARGRSSRPVGTASWGCQHQGLSLTLTQKRNRPAARMASLVRCLRAERKRPCNTSR